MMIMTMCIACINLVFPCSHRFIFVLATHTLDDMKPCTDPMIDHNHSDVFGRRLSDGLPKNKTGGLIFGSLGGSSKGGSYFLGGLIFGFFIWSDSLGP